MDPITIVSSALTIGTLIQEVISLAQKIGSSLSKVSRNRKRLQDLLDHILSTLDELNCLYSDNDEGLEKCSDLRRSLNLLKTDMDRIYERCKKFNFGRDAGTQLSQVKAKVKAWHKRDEIETEIVQLKEHVMSCYAKFTAFSSARIENTSVRVEHALLVHGTETRMHFSRLEILVNRMLLDTDYGHKLVCDLDNRLSKGQYDAVEYQYLALQTTRIIESLQSLAAARTFHAEEPDKNHKLPIKPIYKPRMEARDATYLALSLLRQLQHHPNNLSLQNGAHDLVTMLSAMKWFGMWPEALVISVWIVNLYKTLASENPHAFLPFLGHALTNLAITHEWMKQYDLALITSDKAVSCIRGIRESRTNLDFRVQYAQALLTHGRLLRHNNRLEEALSIMQECTSIHEVLLAELPETFSENPEFSARANALARAEHDTTLTTGLSSVLSLAQCLSMLNRPSEAYHVARKSLNIFPRLPVSERCATTALHDEAFESIFSCLSSIYERHSLPLSLIEDTLCAYRDLARAHPTSFSRYFLQALYVYACICNGTDVEGIAQLKEGPGCRNPLFFASMQEWGLEDFANLSERSKRLGRFKWAKSITRDAIYASYVQGSSCVRAYNLFGVQSLVRALFMSQVNEGVEAIREASETLLSGALDDMGVLEIFMCGIRDLVIFIPVEGKTKLLTISDDVIDYCRSIISTQSQQNVDSLWVALPNILKSYAEILDYYPHRQEDALKAAEESVQLYHKQHSTSTVSIALADTLQSLAYRYHMVGRLEDAISTLQEGVTLLRREIEASPSADSWIIYRLPTALSLLSDYLLQAGRYPEAEAARAEEKVWSNRAPPIPGVTPLVFPDSDAHVTGEEDLVPSSEDLPEASHRSQEHVSFLSPVSSSSSTVTTTLEMASSPPKFTKKSLSYPDSTERSSAATSFEVRKSPSLGLPPPSSTRGLEHELESHILSSSLQSVVTATMSDAKVPAGRDPPSDSLQRRYASAMNLVLICFVVIAALGFLRHQWVFNIHITVSTR